MFNLASKAITLHVSVWKSKRLQYDTRYHIECWEHTCNSMRNALLSFTTSQLHIHIEWNAILHRTCCSRFAHTLFFFFFSFVTIFFLAIQLVCKLPKCMSIFDVLSFFLSLFLFITFMYVISKAAAEEKKNQAN